MWQPWAAKLWFACLLTAIGFIALIELRPTPPWEKVILFSDKQYFDRGETAVGDGFVVARGALTGKGLAYPNNSTTIACYADEQRCLVVSVQQIGHNQIGSIEPPTVYKVTKWDPYEVVAVGDETPPTCVKTTINIERKSQTVVWVVQPINQSTAYCKDSDEHTYKWTIDNPPGIKALREATEKRK